MALDASVWLAAALALTIPKLKPALPDVEDAWEFCQPFAKLELDEPPEASYEEFVAVTFCTPNDSSVLSHHDIGLMYDQGTAAEIDPASWML